MSNYTFKFILLFTLFIISSQLFSQHILVYDIETNSPIENVSTFNKEKTKSSLSDSHGRIDISIYNKDEIIYFQHASYKLAQITKNQITAQNSIIYLEKRFIMLDEFVISASRWEQNTKEIPNKISVINQNIIEFENPQTSADLLNTSNEVFIQKSQLGGGSPMIRGFATSSILLVVDGVRMNNAIYRSGNLQNVISLDANAIENSEIIFGPGSVTYGSDALGGVIDFHTKRVMLSTSDSAYIKTNITSRYSSSNNEVMGHFDLNYGAKKWGIVSSVTYSDYDNLKMGSVDHDDYQRTEYVTRYEERDTIVSNHDPNIQMHTGYSQLNVMQKIRFRPNSSLDLNYGFHYSSTSDLPRYDRLLQYSNNELKYAEWYYGPQKWMMHALNIHSSKRNSLADNIQSTIAYQNYEESRHKRRIYNDFRSDRTEKLNAISLNLDFDKLLTNNIQLFYGIEGNFNSLNSTAKETNVITYEKTPESTRYPDGDNHYTTLAAYASLKKNFEKLTLLAGARYNYVNMYSTLVDTSFFNFPFDEINFKTGALNGSIGLVYRPNSDWQLNLNLSTGFHAPNIDDMAKIFDSEPGNVVVPNEDIKPEYAYNLDVGIQKTWNEKVKLKLSGFYTFLDNAMVRRNFTFNGQDSILYDGEMSKVSAIVNANQAYIYGFSLSISAELTNHISFDSYINYTAGEDQDGYPLRHIAPLFGTTKIKYRYRQLTLALYSNYNGEISNKNLALDEQNKTYIYDQDANGNPYSPAWATINFKAAYNLNNYLSINFGIENITDLRYRPYSSGIVAPGRNFIITLRAKL